MPFLNSVIFEFNVKCHFLVGIEFSYSLGGIDSIFCSLILVVF